MRPGAQVVVMPPVLISWFSVLASRTSEVRESQAPRGHFHGPTRGGGSRKTNKQGKVRKVDGVL